MIYLAFGSNLSGDYASSQQLIGEAIDNLPLCGAQAVRRAPLYRSAPIGPKGQGDYINTVVAVRSVVPAVALLHRLHALEAAFGRTRREAWGPRTLDIDIVSYHDEIHAHMAQIPHPRMAARAFVLYPLRDIAPGWRHPISGHAVEELIKQLPTDARRGIVKL